MLKITTKKCVKIATFLVNVFKKTLLSKKCEKIFKKIKKTIVKLHKIVYNIIRK
jgi:hypothetical protein